MYLSLRSASAGTSGFFHILLRSLFSAPRGVRPVVPGIFVPETSLPALASLGWVAGVSLMSPPASWPNGPGVGNRSSAPCSGSIPPRSLPDRSLLFHSSCAPELRVAGTPLVLSYAGDFARQSIPALSTAIKPVPPDAAVHLLTLRPIYRLCHTGAGYRLHEATSWYFAGTPKIPTDFLDLFP